jgi:hypothetical protein
MRITGAMLARLWTRDHALGDLAHAAATVAKLLGDTRALGFDNRGEASLAQGAEMVIARSAAFSRTIQAAEGRIDGSVVDEAVRIAEAAVPRAWRVAA